MKNLVILQARMGSSRLPGKVLRKINGRPMIEWQIRRIQKSGVEKIVLATSDDEIDDELSIVVGKLGIEVFRGSPTDVHSRFVRILEAHNPDYFIRLTGDCPVVMPDLINRMVTEFELWKLDYLSNTNPPSFPDGLDIEVISTKPFLEFSKCDLTDEEKEHVTIFMRKSSNQLKSKNFESKKDYSRKRWTVDYEEDFNFIKNIFHYFAGSETIITMNDILQAIDSKSVPDNLISYKYRNIALEKGIEFE